VSVGVAGVDVGLFSEMYLPVAYCGFFFLPVALSNTSTFSDHYF
jgi:hypothetical protein